MNDAERDRALANLTSERVEERLAAARYFSRFGVPSDLTVLARCASFETVSWVRKALERAVSHVSRPDGKVEHPIPSTAENEVPSDLVRDMRAEAIEEVASTILHEFSPIVGSLKLAVRAELASSEGTKTGRLVNQLSKMLDALRNLNRAAAVPRYEAVDIPELVSEIVSIQGDKIDGIAVSFAGPSPFFIQADRDALNLAISNGLRNAIEAMHDFVSPRKPEIVFNWGRGGPEYWFAMIDSGPGFQGDPTNALKLGVSNKRDHLGYGLYTAQVAMKSMDGELNISNHISGGALFELRWFKDDAYTIR